MSHLVPERALRVQEPLERRKPEVQEVPEPEMKVWAKSSTLPGKIPVSEQRVCSAPTQSGRLRSQGEELRRTSCFPLLSHS